MVKKGYEAPSIYLEDFRNWDVLMISREIPGGWFDDYDDDWENNF